MHGQTRDRDRADIHNLRTEDVRPGYTPLLGQVVMQRAKARQVLWHEPLFAAERITRRETVTALKHLVDAKSRLIRVVPFFTNISVVVAIDARAYDCRRAHHGHAATVHAHLHIRPRRVLLQKQLRGVIDYAGGNFVIGKRIANDLRISRADRLRWIKFWIRVRAERVVNGDAAHAEIAVHLIFGGHGIDHRVGFDVAQTLVIGKEENAITGDGSADGHPKIIS